jgi:hypothetical protein
VDAGSLGVDVPPVRHGMGVVGNLRRRVKKDALSGLEDAVAWVKEQSYLELIHKTSTIRVIG